VGLAATSVGVYALVFNWKFAVVIVTMLFVHESGHIWAMKRFGMRTKGIYFIPFFGGMAVADDEFPSRKAEVYISLMGPLWGLAYSLAALAIFEVSRSPMFAAVASWTALVTLFNLLPINPLDGGRVTKSIAYSINGKVGLITMIAGMVLAVIIMMALNIWIFALIITLNILEIIIDRQADNEGKHRARREKYEQKIRNIKEELYVPYLNYSREIRLEKQLNRLERRVSICSKKETEASEKNLHRLAPMTRPEIIKSTVGILAVAAASFVIMFAVSHIPGSDLALEVLTD
jgi:Zn-dependent protease